MYHLYHDFNKAFRRDETYWYAPLVCRGTYEDLQKLGIVLSDGMRVMLYMPDVGADDIPDALEVEATIRYDKSAGCFCADFVYDDLMHRTERAKKLSNKSPETNALQGQ